MVKHGHCQYCFLTLNRVLNNQQKPNSAMRDWYWRLRLNQMDCHRREMIEMIMPNFLDLLRSFFIVAVEPGSSVLLLLNKFHD